MHERRSFQATNIASGKSTPEKERGGRIVKEAYRNGLITGTKFVSWNGAASSREPGAGFDAQAKIR
jgi:hypothetical protein